MMKSAGLTKRLEIEGRRIASQHEKLRELWKYFVEPLESGHITAARTAFVHLHDGLVAHFEIEERIEIPALHGAEPGVEQQLQQIVADHDDFRRELASLAVRLESVGAESDGEERGGFEGLAESVASLMQALGEHEALEERLFSKSQLHAKPRRSR